MKDTISISVLKDLIISAIAVSFIAILVFLGGIKMGNRGMENEAVIMGHARYVVDDKDNVSFEWLATETMKLEATND